MTYTYSENIKNNEVALAGGVSDEFSGIEGYLDTLPPPQLMSSSAPNFGVATNTGNSYAVAIAITVDNYVEGYKVYFKSPHTNTGQATLNVNGWGDKPLMLSPSAHIQPGQIIEDSIVEAVYNGDVFIVSPDITYFSQLTYNEKLLAEAAQDAAEDAQSAAEMAKAGAVAAMIIAQNAPNADAIGNIDVSTNPAAHAEPTWLECNGNLFDQSVYPELYAKLGNSNTLPNISVGGWPYTRCYIKTGQ